MVVTGPEETVVRALAALGIVVARFEHPPVFTVAEATEHWAGIDATHCKNLFLRNKKGNRHYLIVLEHQKSADLKRLAEQIGEDRLSFASPDRLAAHLGLQPGAVSPMGLLNDGALAVQVVLDADLRRAERVAFHPNVNTATIVLAWADFERFLESTRHLVRFVTFPSVAGQ